MEIFYKHLHLCKKHFAETVFLVKIFNISKIITTIFQNVTFLAVFGDAINVRSLNL